MDGFRLQKPFSFFEKRCQLTWCKWQHALSWPAMSILELLEQELAAVQTAQQRDRAELQQKIVDVPESDKTCATHGEKTLIGYDVRESLVYIPPQLEIRVTKFPKYACPNQPACKVTQAERPEGLIEGDRYDTSVAAEIITANLGYHLPLYREQACRWRYVGAAAPRFIQLTF